jgi:gliding motility-associated protein GldM
MAGYKETPRQKMIGMMYLVLTALLALNVSKQILDAFIVVNESTETTNTNFSRKIQDTYDKFQIQYQLNPNKVGPYWEKAKKARYYANNLTRYIDSIRAVVVLKTERLETLQEAWNLKLSEAARKDNFDVPTAYFIGSSYDGSVGPAHDLKLQIEKFKVDMIELVDPKYKGMIKMGLDTKGPFYDASGNKQTWEIHNFYHTILAACVTILNQLKADVNNAEFDVINNLFSTITAEDWKFNEIQAKVIPKNNYVFIGEQYQAEILVAAYDTTQNPDVRYMLGVDSLTPANFKNATPIIGKAGIVSISMEGTSEGLKKFAGIIRIISPLGDTMPFHFKDEYIVAKPTLTISPTKMNVFYIGLDNPISITVPGSPERIIPTTSAGKIRPEGKDWIVYDLRRGQREAVVSVSGVFEGKARNMGSFTFRLKPVPDPIAKIGAKSGGTISKSLLVASPYIILEKPVGFDFDLKYTVTSFTFVTDILGDIYDDKVTGNSLTPDIVKMINGAKKNKRIWIENIIAVGPDGEHSVPTIALKIN